MHSKSVLMDSPAKINLSLAITGRRDDGFHELTSVVCPLSLCDRLVVEVAGDGAGDTLECSNPEIPCDGSNLILKAAAAFRSRMGELPGFHFRLTKNIPHGAGLGGGSSNAATALVAMNRLTGNPLSIEELEVLAASIGSDCPLFVSPRPRLITGRGECLEELPAEAVDALREMRVLLFKPSFGVSTPWAYGAFRQQGEKAWVDPAEVRKQIRHWLADPSDVARLLYNSLQPVVFGKYLALAVLTEQIRITFGLPTLMSGSGSSCFSVLAADNPVEEVKAMVIDALGPEAFVATVRCFAGGSE